ncbi:hypothetical protein G3N58_32630 [Paraburkholderia sp. Ac-20342]|uniref:hypothetical protein n=1 Tax=Paraburkholderia sp. Ac-20342 TaxID=2703889 RepID=UPI0019817362|nr:hypothetical protein [Paraburkholderia sp. Ac-20342]MBN3851521.1 hypothetical protein [Paraburkholderia sp. Ac-20342]
MTSRSQHATHPARARRAPASSAASSIDSRLDEALMESFPASDPIAVDMAEPYRARTRKPRPDSRKRH